MKALFLATVEVNGEPPKLMSEDVWLKCLAGTIESQIKEMIIGDVIVTIHTGEVKQ